MPLHIFWRDGVAYLHGTVEGQRIRRSTKTRDPEIAARIRAETEARLIKASLYGVENEATFADAYLLYDADGRSKRYVAPLIKAFGKRRLATIKPGEIKTLARNLYPDAKAATLNRSVIKPARAIVNFAAERGLCAPIRIKMFAEARVVRKVGNRAWIEGFMAHAVNQRVRVLALFMWVTGARLGECIALEPSDLDLDNKTALACRTKNGDPRVYYLTNELVRELRLLAPRAVRFGGGPVRVFGYADNHGPVGPWRKTCERAGIPYLTRHEAGRHSHGTETIVRRKLDPATAAALGGWRDRNVMVKHYAHPENLGEIAEAIFGKPTVTDTSLTQATSGARQDIGNEGESRMTIAPRWGGVSRRGV